MAAKFDTSSWPTMEVNVPLQLSFDPERLQNHLHMAFSDCSSKLIRGDKTIGEIIGCIGGQLEVNIGGFTWTLNPIPLFEAVEIEHKKWLKKNGRKNVKKKSA